MAVEEAAASVNHWTSSRSHKYKNRTYETAW